MKVTRDFVRDGDKVHVQAERIDGDRWRVRVGAAVHEYDARPLADGGVRLVPLGADGTPAGPGVVAYGAGAQQAYMVRLDGRTHALELPTGRRGGAGGGGDGVVRAPMTGTVLDVLCQPGDEVEAAQTLVVVSAMKMEHKLTAGVAGVVKTVRVTKNATVDQGQELVVVEPSGTAEAAS